MPFNQSEKLHQALLAAGVDSTFVPVKNGAHGFDKDSAPTGQQVLEQMLKFFAEKLGK